jgi:hypothetical protein
MKNPGQAPGFFILVFYLPLKGGGEEGVVFLLVPLPIPQKLTNDFRQRRQRMARAHHFLPAEEIRKRPLLPIDHRIGIGALLLQPSLKLGRNFSNGF